MKDQMKITQQDPVNTITLTGAKMSRTALVIDRDVTDEQLGQIGVALVGIEGARSWWIGDYGACLTERKGEHYTAGRAEALGIDPTVWRQYVMVSRFFAPGIRIYDALSFAHYRAALEGCGQDMGVAKEWLKQAQDGGLSVSQLRKAINVSRATQTNDGSEAEPNPFSVIDCADKWATTKRAELPEIDAEQARNLIEVRWFGIVKFIDELREIAKKG